MINYTVVLKSELNFTQSEADYPQIPQKNKNKRQLLLFIILLFFTVCTLFISIKINKQFYTGGH